MAGTVDALARLSVVIATSVLPLTRQAVHLQAGQRVNKQRNIKQSSWCFFFVCVCVH